MVDVTNSDYQFMAEQNKRKYLDMLTTKLFLNNEEVEGLTKGSGKMVIVVCPFCGKNRNCRYADIVKVGHTLCSGCCRAIKSTVYLFGTIKGRLFFYDFGLPHKTKKQWYSKIKAVCECGEEKDFFVFEIKDGDTVSCGCFINEYHRGRKGELNHNWNPNISEEERRRRRNNDVKSWAKAVKERDNWFCQVCGSTEKLVAHHLNNYKDNHDLRYSLENGITLCRDCHTDFHVDFMGSFRTPCTEKDYEIFKSQM